MKKILVLIILTVSMIIMKPTIFIKASTITVSDYDYQNFDMELKLSSNISVSNRITFITPGFGNDIKTWGYNMEENGLTKYMDFSLVNYFKRRGAVVYALCIDNESEGGSYERLDTIEIGKISDRGTINHSHLIDFKSKESNSTARLYKYTSMELVSPVVCLQCIYL